MVKGQKRPDRSAFISVPCPTCRQPAGAYCISDQGSGKPLPPSQSHLARKKSYELGVVQAHVDGMKVTNANIATVLGDGVQPVDAPADGLTTSDWETIVDALGSYVDRLKRDMQTRYGGNKEYGVEDDMFLGNEISKASHVRFKLMEAGHGTR